MAIGETHSDGTAVWTEDHLMGISKLPLVVGYNHSETYQTSGSFTAPVTGLYRITIVGGGGGGGGCGTDARGIHRSGGAGGSGGRLEFYEKLTAGTSYAFVIGAGGTGGNHGSSTTGATGVDGTNGGDSSITINNNAYVTIGGQHGLGTAGLGYGGLGGYGKVNDTYIPQSNGLSGGNGQQGTYGVLQGIPATFRYTASSSSGGRGGEINYNGVYSAGENGYDGSITFEWFDPADAFPNLYPTT